MYLLRAPVFLSWFHKEATLQKRKSPYCWGNQLRMLLAGQSSMPVWNDAGRNPWLNHMGPNCVETPVNVHASAYLWTPTCKPVRNATNKADNLETVEHHCFLHIRPCLHHGLDDTQKRPDLDSRQRYLEQYTSCDSALDMRPTKIPYMGKHSRLKECQRPQQQQSSFWNDRLASPS